MALLQLKVGANKPQNLQRAKKLVKEAVSNKANVVCLPVRTCVFEFFFMVVYRFYVLTFMRSGCSTYISVILTKTLKKELK